MVPLFCYRLRTVVPELLLSSCHHTYKVAAVMATNFLAHEELIEVGGILIRAGTEHSYAGAVQGRKTTERQTGS